MLEKQKTTPQLIYRYPCPKIFKYNNVKNDKNLNPAHYFFMESGGPACPFLRRSHPPFPRESGLLETMLHGDRIGAVNCLEAQPGGLALVTSGCAAYAQVDPADGALKVYYGADLVWASRGYVPPAAAAAGRRKASAAAAAPALVEPVVLWFQEGATMTLAQNATEVVASWDFLEWVG